MPKDRVEKLESINFVWRVKDHINTSRDTTKEDEKWMSKYLRLVAYKEKFGTTAVPFQYKEDKSLGRWVNGQRVAETLGNLREDRKALLDEVGFIWRINRSTIGNLEGGQTSASSATSTTAAATTDNQATTTTTTATTTTTTAALPRRIEMNVVSPSSSETESSPENDSKTKGQQHQDQQFTRVDGEIRPHGVSFERMLMRLVNYKKQYGHVNPPPDYAFLGLGPWTVSLRQKDVEGTLEASKVRRLKSIGFLVDGRDQIWNEQFKQLRQYCNLNGHTQVPSWEDPDLCDWVNAQRSLLERNKLRKDRKAKLASIGFLLDVEQSTQLTAQLSGKSIFTKTTDSSEGAGLLALANLWKSSS